MMQLKWAERKFDFGFQKKYLPFLIERIGATAPRIEELVKNIPDEKLSIKLNKEWSVKQRIGHLTDLEELHETRIMQFKEGLTELRAADMSNKKTYEADHNKKSVTDLIKEFREVRAKFIEEVETLNEKTLDHKSFHPRLQKQITPVDLVYFVGEHDNHHLTIVAQLLKSVSR